MPRPCLLPSPPPLPSPVCEGTGTLATTYHCSIAKAMPINAATGMSASTAAVPRTAMAAHALKLTKAW
jgi:hypothetical protein